MHLIHRHAQHTSGDDIDGDVLQRVVEGVVLLSHEIGHQHRYTVTCESSPRTGDIAVAWYEDDIHCQQYQTANAREDGSPDGLVDNLIPERQVEVDAHHDLCRHDDRYHAQTYPVVGADDVFQNVEIRHHQQEGKQREDDEILHRLGVHLMLVLVLDTCEHNGLVGKAEGLGDHRHNHRNLRAGTIDTQLLMHITTMIDVGEQHLIRRLVQDTCDAQYEDGPRIAEHGAQELCIEFPAETRIFRDHANGEHHGAHQIDVEGVSHILAVHPIEIDEVQENAHADIQQFQGRKLQRFLLLTKVSEGNAQESIDGYRNSHHSDIIRMVLVTHQPADRR